MKPQYSEEDRYKIVMNFIALRGQGRIPILDFSPLVRYLSEIAPLREIQKTNHPTRTEGFSGYVTNPSAIKSEPCYGREDAEEYVNWLIYMLTVDDKVADEQRKEAVNQLFLFIFVLRDKIRVDLADFLKTRFDWEHKVITLKNALKALKTDVEINDDDNKDAHEAFSKDLEKEAEKISTVLERINDWQKHYQPYLDRLQNEQNRFDNVLKSDGHDKKGKR